MYLLKIVNTLKERDDLFVYDDVDFASIVRSFTKEALESIIKATLNQELPLTDKTFRKYAHMIELLTEDKFAEANVWEFLQIVCMAPDDIPDEVVSAKHSETLHSILCGLFMILIRMDTNYSSKDQITQLILN